MNNHDDPMAIAQAHAISAVLDKRQRVARSKQELRMLRSNLSRFESQTRQAIWRRYWFFGLGGCISGIVLSVWGLSSLGWLALPKVSVHQEPVTTAPTPQVPAPSVSTVETTPIALVASTLSKPADPSTKVAPSSQPLPVSKVGPIVKSPSPTPIAVVPAKPENLSHAKDSGLAQDELGFKSSAAYSIVGIPADGVVMIRKNGDNTQQMIKTGSKLPDGEELRSANAATKQIETNARKFIFQPK